MKPLERPGLAAIVLALGLAASGLLIGHGFASGRATDRYVEVKGLSDLAGIRQANQGVFVILPRDQAPGINEGAQLQKIVRVVSTVQYFLR
jgi:uncharacterized protein